ncbi:MAG TPA: hypothetical protein VE685_11980 [Thermoanaerobaculia bacterium]|nr:hypothetical protein [Thermoanaerobaculia bacterium]
MRFAGVYLFLSLLFVCAAQARPAVSAAESDAMEGPSVKLPADLIKPGIHVDLKFDGDIRISDDGEVYKKVTLAELKAELAKVKERGAFIVYSRELPYQRPPESLMRTFAEIARFEIPIQMLR